MVPEDTISALFHKGSCSYLRHLDIFLMTGHLGKKKKKGKKFFVQCSLFSESKQLIACAIKKKKEPK